MMKHKKWFSLATLLFITPNLLAHPVRQDERLSQSFAVSRGGSLEVDIEGGDIRISTWETNEVRVKAHGINQDESNGLRMTQSGNTVQVEFRPPRSQSRNVSFEINIPSQFDLDLHTSGGDMVLQGTLTGTVNGRTSGGDITMADVNGKVDMATSGGDIRVGKIQADAFLSTSGGDIRVEMSSGTVEVSTSGGDINVGSVGKSFTAKTAGGDITVGDVNGDVKASTAGGDIKLGKVSGSASLNTAGGDIQLREASGVVSAKTAGGDIKLEHVSGSLEAKTAGGDIVAELTPDRQGKSRLVTAGGDVKLYLPESSQATIEALIRLEGAWKKRSNEYDIRSDFRSDSYEKNEQKDEIRAVYSLNGGGQQIWLETVNGDIEIRALSHRQ